MFLRSEKGYDKTDGRCHICHRKVFWSKYGFVNLRGAWEVDHSNPRANGGSDRLSNLFPACISCNRSKGSKSTRTQRAKHGFTKAPESKKTKEERRERQSIWILVFVILVFLCFNCLNNINKNKKQVLE